MSPTVTRYANPLPQGIVIARIARARGLTRFETDAHAYAEANSIDEPRVAKAIEIAIRNKNSIPAGSTQTTAWAGALDVTQVRQEVVAFLRDASAYEYLRPRMFDVVVNMPVPTEITAGAVGGLVAEGAAAPITPLSFASTTLPPSKVVALTVISRELLRIGRGLSDPTLRDILIAGLAATIDRVFLDPANVGAITHGATEVTSTGGSAPTSAQLIADLGAMLAAITTSGASLNWIMKRTTVARIALALGAAASDVPRTLLGLPIVISANSPAQVTLLDAAEVLTSDLGYELDVSDEADVELSTTPLGSGTLISSSPADISAVQMTSLWQAGLAAFRQTRFVAWQRARAGCCSFMSVAY